MKKEIIEIINEDIMVLLETLSTFQKLSDRHIYKKMFIKKTQEEIDWMINFKKKYE